MIEVKEVLSKHERNMFADFANKLYAGNKYFVPELRSDVLQTLKPIDQVETIMFLAWDGGNVVGRIAGIINHRANKKWSRHYVRFGYLDFIDDINVSRSLLNAVLDWGRSKGMKHIQGPMGVNDYDKEGMLVEDFDIVSTPVTIYNAPYYVDHMLQNDFHKEADWLSIFIDVPDELPKRFQRVAEMAPEMFGIHIRKLNLWDVYAKGYGMKVFELLNKAYEPLFGFVSMTDQQVRNFVNTFVPLIDLRLVSVVENKDDELVGVAISMASLTEALQKSKGRFFPFGWIHFLSALKIRHSKKADMLLIAVRPDYQGAGVNALLFADQLKAFHSMGITKAETAPQLEFNVKELSQWKLLSPTLGKRRRCWFREIE